MVSREDRRAVVRAVTTPQGVPLLPELQLRLAPEPLAPWEATERLTGVIEGPPFWAHAWPGGLALARLVLDEPVLMRGKRVLDFAAGGGVAGLAAVKAGALEVLATEIDAFALAAIAENAELNGVAVGVTGDDVIGRDEGWDVILVGDVFYEDELSRRVTRWLRALHRRGATVRIGDPGRSFLPMGELRLLQTFAVPAVPAWDSVVDRPARVWTLKGESSVS